MAEVKNAFIKSKMNKDLDSRLIPNGEYRHAQNIQISKSEGEDVGALENVLGNKSIADFAANSGVSDIECIGFYVNEFNNTVFLFFTNYTDPYTGNNQTYNPSADNFIYSYNTLSNSIKKLVEGSFLNFSTNKPIIGVNILENLLFWTDNRNQPRKINIDLASDNPTWYTSEDQISVAKYYPYQSIQVYKQSAIGTGNETSMYNVSEQYLPDGTTLNPYYEYDFAGDPQYLEDKFVRFSYRFKFEDGEYSLIAPFTQSCFIPKQDGYFIEGDEQQTVASTIVDFMENKVDKIDLQIPLPGAANTLDTSFHITEIDIIYKEADALAMQVVETIPVSVISSASGSNTVYEYSYLSQKPYKTLPESEIIRVYDKIPVRAFGQEIISNRVVYSNFQNKHTPPSGIDYQVAATEKYSSAIASSALSRIEYPNHNVKENRNYQVGIVLSDKFGRQSTVILSNNTSVSQGGFGADTVYLPYRTIADSISFAGNSLKVLFNDIISSTKNEINGTPGLYNGDDASVNYNPLGWYSYKIVVKQVEQEYYNVYAAGAMKGQPYWTTMGPPTPTNPPDQGSTFIVLINDNINKVPRDLSEVGAQDKQYRSSVRLFGRVENIQIGLSDIGNEQYYPGRRDFTVNQIADLFSSFDVLQFTGGGSSVIPVTSTNSPYYAFFRAESNPFIAEFVTSQTPANQFGLVNDAYVGVSTTYNKFVNLNILETSPVVSRLDIYYETSTSGLVSTLNTAVGEDTGGAYLVLNYSYSHSEADAVGTVIVNEFKFADILGSAVTPDSLPTITSVYDNSGSGINRATEFSLVQGDAADTYDLKTNDYFYYGSNASTLESYTFTFSVTVGGVTTSVQTIGALSNANPSIDNDNSSTIQLVQGTYTVLSSLSGKNGSNDTNPNTSVYTQGLTFDIAGSTGAGTYSVINNNTVVNSDSNANGTGSFVLRVTDAGGATATKIFNVNFGEPSVPSDFQQSFDLSDGDGYAVWFTSSTTNLEANTPSNLGTAPDTGFLVGFDAPTSLNSTIENNVCADTTPPATFYNETTSSGLNQGTFYVIVEGSNTNLATTPVSPLESVVNVRYTIQYRANSSSSWSTAVDINNNSIDISGTWVYNDTTDGGWDFLTNIFASGTGIAIENQGVSGNPIFPSGAKVFAFNVTGEYRVIVGNLQSNYGMFQSANNPNCSLSEQNANVAARVDIDDFYYPPVTIAPDFGTTPGVYRYQLASNNVCSNTFTASGTTYYAAEPFAKYITQLYTDTSLTTKASLTSGTYRFRRMQLLNVLSTSVSNPEYSKDGAYTASFDSTGLITSTPSPCLY